MKNYPVLEWALPRVFAHRCGGALAPENTLTGLAIAARLGIKAVEFDVMLSADGTPWLIHDDLLERTTNGAGKVCDTADKVLQELDAGGFQHPAFSGEKLPQFEIAALRLLEFGLMANVEIKPAIGHEAETGEVVARTIQKLWQGRPFPLVSSFSEESLVAARKVAPELPLGFLWECPPADWLARMDAIGAYSLHSAAWEISDEMLATAKSREIPVLCYTVNDPAAADALFKRGVSSVFSDRIDLFGGM